MKNCRKYEPLLRIYGLPGNTKGYLYSGIGIIESYDMFGHEFAHIISIEEKDYRRLRKDELLHILGKLGMGGEVPIKQATIQNQLGPGRTVYFAQPFLSDAVTKGA